MLGISISARYVERFKVITAGICALILTVGLARFAYTPMLPIMHDEAGLSDLAAGWLATFNYAGYMMGALIAATMKALSRKFLLYRFGLIIAVITTLAMGLTDNLVLWASLRFIAGISSTAGLLLASGLVLNWLIRERYRPDLGVHFMGLGLGIIVSGLAIAIMTHDVTWDKQWIFLGIFGLIFFIPAWFWMPAPKPLDIDNISYEQRPIARQWLILLILAYFCGGFGYVISATFIVAILEKLPILTGHGGMVWVIVGLAAVPSSFLWDKVARPLGKVGALVLAYGLEIISFILPVVSDNVILNLASAILYGGTFVGIVSLTLSLIGQYFPENPAKAMARLTLSYGVAQITAPVMAGYIAETTGNYHGALIITAIIMGIGVGLLLRLKKQQTHVLQPVTAVS
ncbi:arabinose efflux permease family protein [Beggiatoa alba B18LD]|uniref:Arabinose efflux permease family protein n=1 Tax=Beggiatoa alba B18LD TaxID=395493 RepID=I3CD50_9GAMM|nr:YbfB/YjiJ family MFS transporter [Beggiatoa alba]EIJ41543.1 arabinose efflux permease family protein [Beggiatoa alba B18LD]